VPPDLRFVHAADLHLGSPFRGLVVEDRLRQRVEDATFRAFSRIVDLCLTERAAFLLLAGDLFDTKDRSVKARVQLARQLGRLDAAGIRTFVVHGNHDPLLDRAPGAGLPASVKVFGAEHQEVGVEDERGELLCRVQGISYPREAVTENLARRFRRTRPGFAIGLLHANLAGAEGHANYAPCSLDDLDTAGLDYWALGHVHTRAVHPLPSGGIAVYPGNPQGRHVNEPGPRSCALVEVRDGRPQVRHVEVDDVRWHRVEVDIARADSVEALESVVFEELRERAEVHGPGAHAGRITLTGRGEAHRDLARPGELEALELSWRAQAAALNPPWVLESVRVATQGALDLDQVRAEGGLAAAVLEDLGAQALAALFAEDDLKGLEAQLNRARVGWSPKDEGPGLLEAAAAAVVERLVEEGG
jgi:exonuclease SbcD